MEPKILSRVRVRVFMEVALLEVVVVEVLATVVVQIRPDEALSISCFSAVEVSHSPQSV